MNNEIDNRKSLSKTVKGMKTRRIAMCIVTIVAILICFATPVFAEGGDPLESINKLSDFVFAAIRAIGMIILGFGILQLGMSLKSHDPSQRAQGLMALFGGLVITFSKEILNLIVGG